MGLSQSHCSDLLGGPTNMVNYSGDFVHIGVYCGETSLNILADSTHIRPPHNPIPNINRFIQYNLTELVFIGLLILILIVILKFGKRLIFK